jgi:hypothetical protein
MTSFKESLDAAIPGACDERTFLQRTQEATQWHGFTAANTIACVGLCRDELCRSLVWSTREFWGESFNFSSLAGLLTLGTTGFGAAHHHAPIVGGRERYLYIVMPHIGISAEGEYGKCVRPGRPGSSSACGALAGVFQELQKGELDLQLDHNNLEYSILKQQLAPRLEAGCADIRELTLLMCQLVGQQLQDHIDLTVDTKSADYAVFTGVQVHRPDEGSVIWVDKSYVCVEGKRHDLDLKKTPA